MGSAASTSSASGAAESEHDEKVLSNPTPLPSWTILELSNSRREVYRKNARDKINSELKSIESTAHDPLCPLRPYGLDESLEGHRRHIWDLIFAHVYDADTIESLRQVCSLFLDLLERKYVAATLPEVIIHCLERKIIPWESKRTEKSNWVKTLENLRTLSKTTKHAVDEEFDRGMLGEHGINNEWIWISATCCNYDTATYKIPTLMLGTREMERARLQRILDSPIENFPMRAVVFNEWGRADLRNTRDGFQKCLEKIGQKITSFQYQTMEDSSTTYNLLRKWLVHLPNLEELMVDFIRLRAANNPTNIGPFPKCPKLKRFAEGFHGFGYPYYNEMFKANPSIEEVLIGRIPSSAFEMSNLCETMNTLKLTKFHCTSSSLPALSFFQFAFQWTLTLTSFAWVDKKTLIQVPPSPGREISSDKVFQFLSKLKNLKILAFLSPWVRNTGGYLDLPNLQAMDWKISPSFYSLEFFKPVEGLESLYLDMTSCPQFHTKEKQMQLLGTYHFPALYPALKEIQAVTDVNGVYETVWKASD